MLARLVPGPLVRWFARPYVAGDSIEACFRVADERLCADGVLTTLDLLGEDVRTPAQVRANVATYRNLIELLSGDERFSHQATRPSISIKPSAFTCGEPADARAPIEELAAIAHERAVALTIDMEGRNWTDLTLEMSFALFSRGWDVGTVLQTRLHPRRCVAGGRYVDGTRAIRCGRAPSAPPPRPRPTDTPAPAPPSIPC